MRTGTHKTEFWNAFANAVMNGLHDYVKARQQESASSVGAIRILEVPLKDLTVDQLRRKMKECVQREDFEKAIEIRNILKAK